MAFLTDSERTNALLHYSSLLHQLSCTEHHSKSAKAATTTNKTNFKIRQIPKKKHAFAWCKIIAFSLWIRLVCESIFYSEV